MRSPALFSPVACSCSCSCNCSCSFSRSLSYTSATIPSDSGRSSDDNEEKEEEEVCCIRWCICWTGLGFQPRHWFRTGLGSASTADGDQNDAAPLLVARDEEEGSWWSGFSGFTDQYGRELEGGSRVGVEGTGGSGDESEDGSEDESGPVNCFDVTTRRESLRRSLRCCLALLLCCLIVLAGLVVGLSNREVVGDCTTLEI